MLAILTDFCFHSLPSILCEKQFLRFINTLGLLATVFHLGHKDQPGFRIREILSGVFPTRIRLIPRDLPIFKPLSEKKNHVVKNLADFHIGSWKEHGGTVTRTPNVNHVCSLHSSKLDVCFEHLPILLTSSVNKFHLFSVNI